MTASKNVEVAPQRFETHFLLKRVEKYKALEDCVPADFCFNTFPEKKIL